MLIPVCKAKISNAVVTRTKVEYEGSLGVSRNILEAAGIFPHEMTLVVNMTNGYRFETYIVPENSPGEIAVYGGAAKIVNVGDKIIIIASCLLEESEAAKYQGPRMIRVNSRNEVVKSA